VRVPLRDYRCLPLFRTPPPALGGVILPYRYHIYSVPRCCYARTCYAYYSLPAPAFPFRYRFLPCLPFIRALAAHTFSRYVMFRLLPRVLAASAFPAAFFCRLQPAGAPFFCSGLWLPHRPVCRTFWPTTYYLVSVYLYRIAILEPYGYYRRYPRLPYPCHGSRTGITRLPLTFVITLFCR